MKMVRRGRLDESRCDCYPALGRHGGRHDTGAHSLSNSQTRASESTVNCRPARREHAHQISIQRMPCRPGPPPGTREGTMKVLYFCCAGLDVHKRSVVACRVRTRADGTKEQEIATFGTTTPQLLRLLDW